MPIARFQMPDGRIARFEMPEGSTPEQAQATFDDFTNSQSQETPVSAEPALPEEQIVNKKESPTLLETAFGNASWGDYGKGITDQLKNVVNPDTYSNIGKELSNFPPIPLSEDGSVDLSSPKNSTEDPSFGDKAIGAVTSVMPVSAISKAFRASLAPKLNTIEPARQAALDVAGRAGLYVPRSNIKETVLTNLGERFGGKEAIEASARAKNQPIFNSLAAKSLGIADDTSITPEVLKGIREEAGKAYEAVKNVGTLTANKQYKNGLDKVRSEMSGASKDFPELASADVKKLVSSLNKKTISSEGAVEMVKNLRNAAKSNLGPMASAEQRLLGKAQRKSADLLDDLIESNIEPTLGKEMLTSYRKARELIAKTYTVENALIGQNVSAQKIARTGKKIDLTGELKQISDFATSFNKLSRVEMGAPPSGGLLEPLIYGGIGGLTSGGTGTAAAAIPIIGKPIARKLMVTVPKVSQSAESMVGKEGNQYIADIIRRAIGASQNRSE